jgi:hypothetical protein
MREPSTSPGRAKAETSLARRHSHDASGDPALTRQTHVVEALAAAGPAYVGLADVACQRNEPDAALRDVTRGIALCRQFVYTPPLSCGGGDLLDT